MMSAARVRCFSTSLNTVRSLTQRRTIPVTSMRRALPSSNHKLIGPSFRQAPGQLLRRTLTTAPVPKAGVMDRMLWFPRTYPFAFQAIFATTKTAVSDLVVQVVIEKKEEINWKRTGVFAAFGFGYLGMAQWFFYVTCMKRLFPNMAEFGAKTFRQKLKDGPGMKALAGQVCFDNFVVTPFFYFPFFYVFKQSIQGGFDLDNLDFGEISKDAWAKYRMNMSEDLKAMWSLWVPGDVFIYAIPVWMRLPANHVLSLFWTMILSYFRGDAIEDAEVLEDAEGCIGEAPSAIRRLSRRRNSRDTDE
jgi:hypothetical protein